MNWRLIFGLSLFGLAMAFATVFIVPSNIEPFCWIAIFLICAYLIAKVAPGKYFLHGLMVSIVNSIWITAAHVLLFDQYVATHAKEAAMMQSVPMNPKVMMMCTGPIVGVISGLILGLFAWIASKLVTKNAVQKPGTA
jgi:hypothetical protein